MTDFKINCPSVSLTLAARFSGSHFNGISAEGAKTVPHLHGMTWVQADSEGEVAQGHVCYPSAPRSSEPPAVGTGQHCPGHSHPPPPLLQGLSPNPSGRPCSEEGRTLPCKAKQNTHIKTFPLSFICRSLISARNEARGGGCRNLKHAQGDASPPPPASPQEPLLSSTRRQKYEQDPSSSFPDKLLKQASAMKNGSALCFVMSRLPHANCIKNTQN